MVTAGQAIDVLGTRLRHGVRALLARPGLTVTMVCSLAIGLGANALLFAVVDAAILRPFPFPEPDRFVGVGAAYPKLNRPLGFFEVLSGPEIEDLRTTSALKHIAAFDLGNEPVMIGDTPERVFTAYVWDDPLLALGLPPALGRSFTAEDLETAAPVAVVSHQFWTTYLGARPDAIGDQIRVGGRPHVVIGVMPDRTRIYGTDLWIPMSETAATIPRDRRQFNVVGRLADDVSLERANEELSQLAHRLERTHVQTFPEYEGLRFAARPWTEIEVWGFSGVTTVVLAAVGLTLLLITANLAGLLAARSAARRGEMAVRTALGADRRALVGQLITETALYTVAGTVAGLLLAWVGLQALPVWLPPGILPDEVALGLSPRLLGALTLLAVMTAGLVSLAPTWQLVRTAPAVVLNADAGRALGGKATRRLHAFVVVFEVAAAVMVAGGAVLLTMNTWRLLDVDRGFDTANLLRARITLPLNKYDGTTSLAFFDTLLERVRALPNVEDATVSNQPPPGVFSRSTFAIASRPTLNDTSLPTAFYSTVGSRFRETLGFRLSRGRWFNDIAPMTAPREVVINETLANRYFAGEDPIGQRIQIKGAANDDSWADVVGVVADVRNAGVASPPQPEVFGSVRQIPDRRRTQLYVVVRTRTAPDSVLSDVRSIVRGIDEGQPIYAITTVDRQYEGGVATRRTAGWMLGIFGALSLGLASLGIFGVLSYAVSERTREIGLRLALGADRRSIRRLMLAQAMRPVLLGVTLGVTALVAGQRVLAGWLYGVTPELTPLVLVVAAVVTVSAAASALPMVRASRLSPLEALSLRR